MLRTHKVHTWHAQWGLNPSVRIGAVGGLESGPGDVGGFLQTSMQGFDDVPARLKAAGSRRPLSELISRRDSVDQISF